MWREKKKVQRWKRGGKGRSSGGVVTYLQRSGCYSVSYILCRERKKCMEGPLHLAAIKYPEKKMIGSWPCWVVCFERILQCVSMCPHTGGSTWTPMLCRDTQPHRDWKFLSCISFSPPHQAVLCYCSSTFHPVALAASLVLQLPSPVTASLPFLIVSRLHYFCLLGLTTTRVQSRRPKLAGVRFTDHMSPQLCQC